MSAPPRPDRLLRPTRRAAAWATASRVARSGSGGRRRARVEAIRAVEGLYAAGLDDLALSLAFDAGRQWRDEAQLAALAEVVKHAATRGLRFNSPRTPSCAAIRSTHGVSAFRHAVLHAAASSADLASVYARRAARERVHLAAASGAAPRA